MELALILLGMALIIAAIGWAVFAAVNKIDRATTHTPPKPTPKE